MRDLEPAAGFAQPVEFVDVLRGELQMVDHRRADAAGDVEKLARVFLELGHRGNPVALGRRHQQWHLARLGFRDGLRGGRLVRQLGVLGRLDHGAAVTLDDVGGRKLAQAGLHHDEALQLARISADGIGRRVEVARHVDDVGADHLPMLVEVGGGNIERARYDLARAGREPAVERAREGHRGADRQQQRRQGRDDAEQRHDADVQPRAGDALAPRAGKADHLPGEQRDHRDDEHDVDEENDEDDFAARRDRRQAREDQVGRERGHEREEDDACADAHRPVARVEGRGAITQVRTSLRGNVCVRHRYELLSSGTD